MNFRLTCIALFILSFAKAQWSNKSFTFDAVQRDYRIYVSPNYTPSKPASLVITLHGLGDNMTNFSNIGMNLIADTANIIVVVPQALADPLAGNAWNSKAGIFNIYPNTNVNDIGFINALVDTTAAKFAVDLNKVYLCGFSMGGFMTNRMACESNGKFAAFGSVAGTFGAGLGACNPGKSISIVHFHGTADGTVGFYTNNYGVNADSLVNFWVNNNNCAKPGQLTNLPDLQNDGYTVDHYKYSGNKNIEFFRVNGANHVWLTPANDIAYTIELWKFFRKHSLATGLSENKKSNSILSVFPNPTSGKITVKIPEGSMNTILEVYDLQGSLLCLLPFEENKVITDLKAKGLGSGAYLLVCKSELNATHQILIVE